MLKTHCGSGLFRQVIGSRQTALETVLLLRQVVASAKFNSIEQLIGMVKGVGKRLIEAQPKGMPNTTYIFCHR